MLSTTRQGSDCSKLSALFLVFGWWIISLALQWRPSKTVRYQMLSKKNQLEANKLQKRLRRNVGNAIADYNMIEQGDRVMVCLYFL